jgi:serine/threonine protein kinase/Tol biopolymer transport system component
MGDVYQASDRKLNREVAIKVLPEIFAHDAGRMARFEREAKVLASLNHPNIAHIYGVEEHALVMELAEGESPKGPMPFDEAWKIAIQIADALEYAHERGVVHRDLKPANIKVTQDGVVKLLDFGLAKAFSDTPDTAGNDPSNSPTLTLGGTVVGTIMGTAAYMAPEQAKGKRVDKRADIWSWGVVLYELLTGERLFRGEDAADTLAQVLTKEPPLERVPQKVQRLLGECLQKDPKLRLRDIGDAKRFLDGTPHPARPAALLSRLGWVSAAVLAVAFGLLGWRHLREEPPQLVKLSFPPPENRILQGGFPTIAVSPNTRRVAFETTGPRALWVRDLDNFTSKMVAPLGVAPCIPFWAPDGHRLAFFNGTKLETIDINGGAARTLIEIGSNSPGSGSWNGNDVIIFGRFDSPLFRIPATPASGGSPVQLTQLDKARDEIAHWAPWFLPDGRHFLYVAVSSNPERSAVYAGDLDSKIRKQILPFGTRAIYVSPGYLLYVREGKLMAQPFDPGKLETTGDPISVAERVQFETGPLRGNLGPFAASDNGVLMYQSSKFDRDIDSQLTWFDRSGRKLGTVGTPGVLQGFALSKDDGELVVARQDRQDGRIDLFNRDLVRDSELRLTFKGNNRYPVWSADGTHIFFSSNHEGAYKVYQQLKHGTEPDGVVEATPRMPSDASRDYLFTNTSVDDKNGADIWITPLFGNRKSLPYVDREFQQRFARLSPTGRWLAYQSNESMHWDVYVESFPQHGERWPVSTNGGRAPVWRRDGRELYYYSLDGKIMAVEIKPGEHFERGTPTPLFEAAIGNAGFEVSNDGRRFLLPVPVEQADDSAPMNVVLNWPEMLKKK